MRAFFGVLRSHDGEHPLSSGLTLPVIKCGGRTLQVQLPQWRNGYPTGSPKATDQCIHCATHSSMGDKSCLAKATRTCDTSRLQCAGRLSNCRENMRLH